MTPKVGVLAELAESQGAAAILTAATFEGKEVAGRVAARLGSGLIADAIAFGPGGTATHSIFGGAFTVEATAGGDTPSRRCAPVPSRPTVSPAPVRSSTWPSRPRPRTT